MEVSLYEDGIRSYAGDIFRVLGWPDDVPESVLPDGLFNRFMRVIVRMHPLKALYGPTAIYVKRSELVLYHSSFEVRKLHVGTTASSNLSSTDRICRLSDIEVCLVRKIGASVAENACEMKSIGDARES